MNGPAVPDYPEDNLGQFHRQDSGYGTQPQSVIQMGYPPRQHQQQSYTSLKEGSSFDHDLPSASGGYPPPQGRPRPATVQGLPINGPAGPGVAGDWLEMNVTLLRHETGFGFRIVGGTEEGSQVSIGHIVPGGAADLDGRLRTGDEILAVDQMSVVHTSHHHVVQLMGAAALNGRVNITVRRWIPAHPASLSPHGSHPISISTIKSKFNYCLITDGYPSGVMMGDGLAGSNAGGHASGVMYPYDVTVMRREDEGFGFVIISSVTKGVSFIGQIIRDSPAERCGRLHVGDRILAVNRHDISRLHHGDIVNLIKDSGYTVTLTVGPPLDDGTASSNASNSHRVRSPKTCYLCVTRPAL